MSIKISASTLPPAKEDLKQYILELNKTNVDFLHCDVMDGHFVKNKTYGIKEIAEIKKITNKKLDVHLMVKHPTLKLKRFINAGSNILTIHYEAYKNKKKLIKDLQKIKELGAKSGLAFNPNTSVLDILPFIYFCDVLVIMSAKPGFGGQKFMPETFVKIDTIKSFLKKQKLKVMLEVDCGVNNENLPTLVEKEVDCVVIGKYLYSSKNYAELVNNIKLIKKD